ncbi:hypothetical protein [Nocardioides marmoribigeumensis]|uniref:Sulfotransferase family protein n=1 Tax=Nocardioides marmoribigeumensis TaxID=433649 RepID=A0ABU2BV25_9ACTN|nr:hypothetical protein [Nocardioides marmoribigeumensis]MDR7362477.1 hypothetical protein [Nocardioides marmoribigeumensis]
MADVVHLHVGAPKTGTTYLQDRLALNRGSLEDHGVAYPIGLKADMFGAALDLIDLPWGGQREAVRGDWESLMGRVRRAPGRAIISHEILAGAKPKQVEKAMRDLAETEMHLVFSARDLARQIPAEWQETVKHRRVHTFRRFLGQVMESPRRNPRMWFWRAQSLPDVLTRWSSGLSPDRVHLVTVPQSRAGGTLWTRYCEALELDPAWLTEDSERANVSVGIDETIMLRRLNRRLRAADLDSESYRAIVRELVVHQRLALREDKRKVTLPPSAFDWAEEVAEEWMEWVRGSGIHVVGDLEDLRPRRPDPDASWEDPDKPRQGKVGDATMDALVTVIMELAERPDPDQGPVSRLARAARRLRGDTP